MKPACGERPYIYIPGTRYNFRSSRALRQLNRGVHSKTKPTADWLQSHYIHCSKSWVREVLDKSRGIEWHLTVVYLFIYFFDVLYDHYHKGKSQSQRIILIYYLHYSSSLLFPKQLRYLQLEYLLTYPVKDLYTIKLTKLEDPNECIITI